MTSDTPTTILAGTPPAELTTEQIAKLAVMIRNGSTQIGKIDVVNKNAPSQPIDAVDQQQLEDCACEINRLSTSIAWKIIELGKHAWAARTILSKYRNGSFAAWINLYCQTSASTIYGAIQVYEKFGDIPTVGKFDTKALLILAYDSTPVAARDEAIRRAEAGEIITTSVAKSIIADAKEIPSNHPRSINGDSTDVDNDTDTDGITIAPGAIAVSHGYFPNGSPPTSAREEVPQAGGAAEPPAMLALATAANQGEAIKTKRTKIEATMPAISNLGESDPLSDDNVCEDGDDTNKKKYDQEQLISRLQSIETLQQACLTAMSGDLVPFTEPDKVIKQIYHCIDLFEQIARQVPL